MAHSIQAKFLEEWMQRFPLKFCAENPIWEIREREDNHLYNINKETGEIVVAGKYTEFPSQYVTAYAKVTEKEDFAESVVAYLFDPGLLKRVSPKKFDFINQYDAQREPQQVQITKAQQVVLPEVKEQVIKYYIVED